MDQLHQYLIEQIEKLEKRLAHLENRTAHNNDVDGKLKNYLKQSNMETNNKIKMTKKLTMNLITNQDLIQLLKVSERTLANYRKNKILPYIKFGGLIYYRKNDINKIFGLDLE